MTFPMNEISCWLLAIIALQHNNMLVRENKWIASGRRKQRNEKCATNVPYACAPQPRWATIWWFKIIFDVRQIALFRGSISNRSWIVLVDANQRFAVFTISIWIHIDWLPRLQPNQQRILHHHNVPITFLHYSCVQLNRDRHLSYSEMKLYATTQILTTILLILFCCCGLWCGKIHLPHFGEHNKLHETVNVENVANLICYYKYLKSETEKKLFNRFRYRIDLSNRWILVGIWAHALSRTFYSTNSKWALLTFDRCRSTIVLNGNNKNQIKNKIKIIIKRTKSHVMKKRSWYMKQWCSNVSVCVCVCVNVSLYTYTSQQKLLQIKQSGFNERWEFLQSTMLNEARRFVSFLCKCINLFSLGFIHCLVVAFSVYPLGRLFFLYGNNTLKFSDIYKQWKIGNEDGKICVLINIKTLLHEGKNELSHLLAHSNILHFQSTPIVHLCRWVLFGTWRSERKRMRQQDLGYVRILVATMNLECHAWPQIQLKRFVYRFAMDL